MPRARILPALLLALSTAHAQPGYDVSLVYDRPNGAANPSEFTLYDGRLFFTAAVPGGGCTIWAYDEVTGEISLEVNITPGCSSFRPVDLTVYEDRLYFNAEGTFRDWELWALGPIDATATEPEPSASFELSAAAPNPSSSGVALRLSLPGPAVATVEAFDALGRRVAVLHDGPVAAGEQTLRWEAEGLPTGVYVVDVRTSAGDVATQRVTLVR